MHGTQCWQDVKLDAVRWILTETACWVDLEADSNHGKLVSRWEGTYLSPGELCFRVSTSVNTTEEPPPALALTSPYTARHKRINILSPPSVTTLNQGSFYDSDHNITKITQPLLNRLRICECDVKVVSITQAATYLDEFSLHLSSIILLLCCKQVFTCFICVLDLQFTHWLFLLDLRL